MFHLTTSADVPSSFRHQHMEEPPDFTSSYLCLQRSISRHFSSTVYIIISSYDIHGTNTDMVRAMVYYSYHVKNFYDDADTGQEMSTGITTHLEIPQQFHLSQQQLLDYW